MSAASKDNACTTTSLAYRRTYPLRKGYAVEFVLEGGRLDAIWSPRCPGHKCSRKLLHAYRDARNHFIGSLGLPALVIEL